MFIHIRSTKLFIAIFILFFVNYIHFSEIKSYIYLIIFLNNSLGSGSGAGEKNADRGQIIVWRIANFHQLGSLDPARSLAFSPRSPQSLSQNSLIGR
jgi:hypothetical protein